MKYYEVRFTITPYSADAADILSAMAGDAGFESFESTSDGLSGYVQQQLFDQSLLDAAIEAFPFEGTHIIYKVEEAENRDWNEQWEQEGFDPITVGSRLVIHDGRHLPDTATCPAEQPLQIEIDARMAFGTGSHQTTRMVCACLLGLPVGGKRVLDCGTGTGILSILALKLGAASATGYDIDEWAVDNARHNAIINRVDDNFETLLGDATVLDSIDGQFDIVVANINRNILLADMPRLVRRMATGAHLIISGFYTADIPMLTEKAGTLGLRLEEKREDDDWACLQLAYSL